MKKDSLESSAAISGVVSIILFLIGWITYGQGPTVGDTPADILEFFSQNADRVIWSMFVQGIGTLAMIWFMAALYKAMQEANESILALASGLSFAVALALGSAATMMRSGIAFISVGNISPDTVATIYYLGSVIDTGQNMISAGIFLPVAIAAFRTGFIPAGWGWMSIIAAIWAVASTTALNHSGFWSPNGAGFINLVFYMLWVGGTSIFLFLRLRVNSA